MEREGSQISSREYEADDESHAGTAGAGEEIEWVEDEAVDGG